MSPYRNPFWKLLMINLNHWSLPTATFGPRMKTSRFEWYSECPMTPKHFYMISVKHFIIFCYNYLHIYKHYITHDVNLYKLVSINVYLFIIYIFIQKTGQKSLFQNGSPKVYFKFFLSNFWDGQYVLFIWLWYKISYKIIFFFILILKPVCGRNIVVFFRSRKNTLQSLLPSVQ